MKNIKKFCAACCLVANVSLIPVFAQESLAKTNTYKSTAGTIKADQDKYIDLNYFNEVEFNKAFAFTNLSNYDFQLGGATKINDMYLGGYYSGKFWGSLTGQNNKYSKNDGFDNKGALNSNTSESLDSKYIKSTSKNNQHFFEVLFGLNNMGFKLSSELNFRSTKEKLNKNYLSSSAAGSNEEYSSSTGTGKPEDKPNYKDYKYNEYNDFYKFDLGWGGMSLTMNDTVLKPYASLGVDISNSFSINDTVTVKKVFDKASNKYTTNTETTTNMKNNSGNTKLNALVGSEFVWGKDSNFMQVLNVSDNFGIKIFPPKESYIYKRSIKDFLNNNNSDYTTVKTIQGKVDWDNAINTGYRFEYKPVENLTLGFRADFNTKLTYFNPGKLLVKETNVSGKQTYVTEYDEYYENNSYTQGSDGKITVDGKAQPMSSYKAVDKVSKIFTTEMTPSFGVGLSYAVKPNFVVNLGYSGTVPRITVTDETTKNTTVTTSYNSDNTEASVTKNETSDRNVSVNTGNYYSSLSTGFVLGLGQYCKLDVAVNIMQSDREPSLNDIWTAGWNLGFSFKM